MNFKEYFTESSRWKREDYIGTHHKEIEPIEPYLTEFEKQLLNQWRESLEVGDRVDIIDIPKQLPGIVHHDVPIDHFQQISGTSIKLAGIKQKGHGVRYVSLDSVFPVGYMPGNLTKKQLSPDTLNTFGDLIDEL